MIGTGIFTTTGFMAGDLGSPAVVLAVWGVGGFLALVGALCYSELAVNFPRSGGEYVYLSEAYGPSWGFIDGWVSFFAGFSAPIAASALAMASYLAYFDPALDPESATAWSLGALNVRLGAGQAIACLTVALFTGMNVLGVSPAARAQNILTALKVAILAALLVFGFSVGEGSWAHFSQAATRTSTNTLPAQFALSLIFAYFGYSGWNAAVYVAEEIRDPERTLPRALLAGAALVTLFYLALNCLFIYANPLEEMKGVVAVGAQAADALFGARGGGFFAAAMAASLLATINAMCVVGPRVYYAMARDGAFFAVAARVHPERRSPWVAILAPGACACLLIATGTFASLLYYIGFTLWLFTALAVVGLFRFRRRAGWKRSPWVSFAWPAIPILYAATNLWIFVYFAADKSWEALWSLGTIAAGGAVYHWIKPRRSKPSSDAGSESP